ncbi:hypothetical protein SEA_BRUTONGASTER_140 [Gordonia phage BrutonGaster]|uniref:Uncharacterized protein n=1 Tax=Gordonia phage BrutonGaster TaxID=2530116 RepID=A0A482JN97_9CAUD|nr:hypothetical protein HOV26_gp042 [Gordonia phage BrutonGaster]QBP33354.1 hypothetical protein SEA_BRUTONGASTER_140 [Gordonia phage BrutonGaster]
MSNQILRLRQVETVTWYIGRPELAEMIEYMGHEYPELSGDMTMEELQRLLDEELANGGSLAEWVREAWFSRSNNYDCEIDVDMDKEGV